MLLPMLVKALMSGGMNGEFTYVVRGAEISCSEGSDPGVLNLPLSHGIYIKEQPVMNVADVIPLITWGGVGFVKRMAPCVNRIRSSINGAKGKKTCWWKARLLCSVDLN